MTLRRPDSITSQTGDTISDISSCKKTVCMHEPPPYCISFIFHSLVSLVTLYFQLTC